MCIISPQNQLTREIRLYHFYAFCKAIALKVAKIANLFILIVRFARQNNKRVFFDIIHKAVFVIYTP